MQGKDPGSQLVTQYWAMYPRASADGAQLYFATDRYKHVRCCPFDVTMRVAQMPLSGGTPKFWTVDAVTATDTHTQDGDYAEPLPLKSCCASSWSTARRCGHTMGLASGHRVASRWLCG